MVVIYKKGMWYINITGTKCIIWVWYNILISMQYIYIYGKYKMVNILSIKVVLYGSICINIYGKYMVCVLSMQYIWFGGKIR